MTKALLLKDDHLADIAQHHNVARFASFAPGSEPSLRHAYIIDGEDYADLDSALRALYSVAPTVNVRLFSTSPIKGAPFTYGVPSLLEASALVRKYCADGLHVIVNETIDVKDGGISGVSLGGIVEFAPGDTPRTVEKVGVTSVSRQIGLELFRTVYGVQPDLPTDSDLRVEFSLHPNKVGFRKSHTIFWEREQIDSISVPWYLRWPNKFSRFIGDKAFGLLIGHLLGAPVPETTVIGRNVTPFQFGAPTGNSAVWFRTCPAEQAPGKFPTQPGWPDPFKVMQDADPTGSLIASTLAQKAVDAAYSGASLPNTEGYDEIQGVRGAGDRFMLGEQQPTRVPQTVSQSVQEMISKLSDVLGPVRTEWAHDGDVAWLLQLHVVERISSGATIYPGDADQWLEFDPDDGLDVLKDTVRIAVEQRAGVHVVRAIGTTSHVGDILRKAKVPARIVAAAGS